MSYRDYKLDNLKALLIFCVVLGHLLELFGGQERRWIYIKIYCFNMPAFVFVSGIFSRMNPERFIRQILYSYVVYQSLYLLFQRLCLKQENIFQFATPYWLLWYLVSLMFWLLFLPIINGFSRKWVLIVSVILALLIGFDQSIGYYMSFSRTLVLLPFFVAGHYKILDCSWVQKNSKRMIGMPNSRSAVRPDRHR